MAAASSANGPAWLKCRQLYSPADSAARIDLSSVKSAELEESIGDLETIRDFERFLRDAGGLSKGLAEALVSRAS